VVEVDNVMPSKCRKRIGSPDRDVSVIAKKHGGIFSKIKERYIVGPIHPTPRRV
jgi:hypothetical protein